jgi:exonuclease SbcD
MRFLHTSDWHLGRTLHGVDLLEHQGAYLDHLVELARAEQVDAVFVAGDVYDRAVAPVGAVRLFEDALRRLSEIAPVIVTSGNHDSATRLGFGAALMRPGIHLATRTEQVATPFEIPTRDGPPALVYALPYLDPDATRAELSPGAGPLPRSHEAVLGAAMDRVRADLARRGVFAPDAERRPAVVVVAHAFVIGGKGSQSERDIRVGGVDAVPASVFDGGDYVALGHLHGPQEIHWPAASRGSLGEGPEADGGPVIRYAGSPLAYSFSEVGQRKSTVLGTVSGGGRVRTELVSAPVARPLGRIEGLLADLLGEEFADRREHWLEVTVTDPVRPPDFYQRVKARFPHALQIAHRAPGAAPGREGIGDATGLDPLVVAAGFVEFSGGEAPTEAETAVLRDSLESVRAAERSE